MRLLNNSVMAEKRAHYLKRKFPKDELSFSHYKDFMNEIIKKSYARVSDRTPADGKLWYLPHHGGYHPKSPIKSALYLTAVLSMLVDLSTKSFWFELTLLIRSLVSSSDLAKDKLLLWQTQRRCSFRSLLRFLSKTLIDHEMCVHVFGGKSSPNPHQKNIHRWGRPVWERQLLRCYKIISMWMIC